jgi:hypothetical protein
MKSKRFTEQQISGGLKQAQAGRADQGAMPHTALAMRRSIGNTSAPRDASCWIVSGSHHLGIESVDNLLRRLCGSEQPVPDHVLETRNAGFRDGGKIGQVPRSLGAAHRNASQLSGFHARDRARGGGEIDLGIPSDESRKSRRRACGLCVHEVDSRRPFDPFHCKMRPRTIKVTLKLRCRLFAIAHIPRPTGRQLRQSGPSRQGALCESVRRCLLPSCSRRAG